MNNTLIKQLFLSVLSLFLVIINVKSQDYTTVLVQLNNGTNNVYNIEEEGGIYFSDDEIFIYTNQQTPLNFLIDEVKRLKFLDITEIESVISDSKLSVYPNPAIDYIYISGIINQDITLYSVCGIKIKNFKYSSGEMIDISNLQKGIYFIRLSGKTLKFTKL